MNYSINIHLILFFIVIYYNQVNSFYYKFNKVTFKSNNCQAKRISKQFNDDIAEIINKDNRTLLYNTTTLVPLGKINESATFPEIEQFGIDEKALRESLFGQILFKFIDIFFPVFKEPNWFDLFDPPLTTEENFDLPYFDGYDFVNSSWTIYIRQRYGVWNWLDRFGFVPLTTQKVFFREDGKTVWADGFYGDWYINPAINYIQFEKQYGRGYGYTQYPKGLRVYQIQRWNLEEEVGRYWNRGLRSYLRNETNYWAIEGKVWGMGLKWRFAARDQGKFIAIRDGTNLTEVFGNQHRTPWEERFHHSMSLPFYQSHPDQLERIEDNFDFFYRNLLGREVR